MNPKVALPQPFSDFERLLSERIVLLDGAMGSMIQRYKLTEADYRGKRFASHGKDLKGNADVLVLTRPDVISEIHQQYLDAGADIIETNTFSSTRVAQADYAFEPISIAIGPVNVSTARVVALAITILVAAAMGVFLFRTMPGKALRAAAMNREAIQIVGVDIVRLSALAFAIAFGIAGMTGVLIALVFPAFNPFSGAEYSIIGFIVIVLGGLGNPVGALIAGMFYGVAEQMATGFLPQALAQIVGFALLVGTILVRPTGLFGFRVLR